MIATKGGIDKFVYRRSQRTCLYRRRASSAGAVAPHRPQVQGRTWFARTFGVVAGARRNGPIRPHTERTAERRQHRCLALLPRQRIGHEVVAGCMCSDKFKYKYGRGIYVYIYMRHGCHLLYKLWHSTQLHWSPCHTHWEVAGIGKYHPLLCAFAALAGCRLFCRLCFGTPDFPTANSQMRIALLHGAANQFL
jgi:hypothetical protein